MSRSPSHLTGGIVWKNISGHYHIALIADHNNRKSWKLPVVKQDQYVQAASDPFEEISLITGVEVKDPVSADTVFYPDNDPPSYAIFWHLRVKANTREFTPSGNRHVKWVPPSEAISLLALESEKRLIRSIHLPAEYKDSGSNVTLQYEFSTHQSRFVNKDALQRLEGDLRAHSAILQYRIRVNTLHDGSVPAWGEQAGTLVNLAYEQMKRGKLDQAWKSLHASMRLSIFGMTETELNDLAKRVRQEAGNLNEWRKAAVHRLLGEFEQPGRQVPASTLYIAAEIRDEHFHNIYYKNRLTKTVINTLLLLLTVTVSCIFIYMAYITYVFPVPLISFPNGTRLLQTMPVLTGAMLFGLFGGVMSSLFRVRRTSDSLKNPELISTYFFTTIRVFTGGAAAIAIFFFLESEFYDLIIPALELQPSTGFTYFVLSFLCGFSERLLMRAVSSFTSK